MKRLLLLAVTIFCISNFIHAQAGQLDPSFGNNGIVTTGLGKNYTYPGTGKLVLSQPDGSSFLILQTNIDFEGFNQGLITKRHTDGSIDSSYGINGFSANVKMSPTSAVLQADGKIVLGGYYDNFFNNYNIVLARFNTNGNLDSNFDGDGIQSNLLFHSEEGNYDPKLTVLQYKGKTVVAGDFTLARYTFNGELDSTFGEDGNLEKDFVITGGAIQSDGKIVLSGYTDPSTGDPVLNIIASYNTDGNTDQTFGNNGKKTTESLINSLIIQKDEKILAGGEQLIRFNTDGSLDSSFSDDGIVTTSFKVSEGYSISLQADGKIVVTGNTGDDTNPVFTIARYNTNGSIDDTFSGDGMLTNKFSIGAATVQKDNRIIVAGTDHSKFALARYTSKGTSDNTFGKNGKLTDSVHSGYTVFTCIAIEKDGKKVVAGRTWNGSNFDFALARYNTDGSLDKTFSSNGAQTTDFRSKDDFANSVAIQTDGKIVVVGYSGKFVHYYFDNVPDSNNISIARYNIDGSLDNSFDNDGKVQTHFEGGGAIARSVAIDNDEKILAAGNFGVARYNTDGSADKTFGENGNQFVGIYASSIALQSNRKIVVVGNNGYSAYTVTRLNSDGTADNTFGDNGAVNIETDLSFVSVVIQHDGKIVTGGFTYYRGNTANFITRFNTDGKLDKSFSQDGQEGTGLEGNEYYPINDFGNMVAIQDDEKIVVSTVAITRYNTNGSLDSTFGSNGIQALPVRENNRLINAITISGNKLNAVGFAKSPGNVGLIGRYLLYTESSNTPPTITITSPINNAKYLAPAAHVKLSATAADTDGTITKVQFYKDSILLHTETVIPYGFVWRNVPLGNYTLTAKAYDNSGNVTTSAPVYISVVPNKAPVVSIVAPVKNQTYTVPANINFEAAAADTDGRITNVKFYNGTRLLNIQYQRPYTYNWANVPEGTYTITAVATDNWGAQTISATITVKVVNASIVGSKPYAENGKTTLNDALSLRLSPNPATNFLNIYTNKSQPNKPATLSIISVSGIVLKIINISNAATQLDVSSLPSGIYMIKVISGDKVLYKQLVKL